MTGNTKALRLRIKSVTSTLQLTNAMGLVAASKIRRANITMQNGRKYRESLDRTISLLTADRESLKSPYMQKRDGDRTRLIVIAGDKGMAGGYNANIFRLMRDYPDAEVYAIGKRATEKYGKPFVSSEHFSFEDAALLADTLCTDFANGDFDRLGIVATKYLSAMSQEAYIEWLLPFEKTEAESVSAIFEPDHLTVLNNVAREYLAGVITVAVRESFAAEVAARRMAMDSAGKNATEMISDLQLRYNRARQGAITQEITEIVAGSGN